MARNFTGGTAVEHLQTANTSFLNGAAAATIAVWVNRAGAVNNNAGIVLQTDTGTNAVEAGLRILSSNMMRSTFRLTAGAITVDAGTIPLSTPAQLTTRFTGAAIENYIDGALAGSAAASGSIVTGSFPFVIGKHLYGSSTNTFNGSIAEAAIWDVSLGTAEIAALAKGASPLTIRPASLLAYWPIRGRVTPEPELISALGATVTTAAYAVHPRVFYPHGMRSVPLAAVSNVSRSGSLAVEARGYLGRTAALRAEALGFLAGTKSIPFEAWGTTPVAQTAQFRIEALATVSQNRTLPLEAVVALAQSGLIPLESIGAVVKSGVLRFEAMEPITISPGASRYMNHERQPSRYLRPSMRRSTGSSFR